MIRKLFFDIKSLWRCLLCFAFVGMVVLPTVNHFQSEGFPISETIGSVLSQAQLVLPAVCALPVAFLLYRRFDDGLMEPLHALPSFCRTGKWNILLFEGGCLLLCLPVFLWYRHLYGVFLWQEWMRTVTQAFFLQNIAYAAVYLTHFPMAGIAAQILLIGAMQYPLVMQDDPMSILRVLNIYESVTALSPRPWNPLRLIIVFACGTLLWSLGAKREKFFLE